MSAGLVEVEQVHVEQKGGPLLGPYADENDMSVAADSQGYGPCTCGPMSRPAGIVSAREMPRQSD